MVFSSWALIPPVLYVAYWSINPLRSRLAFARRLCPRPVPTHFAGQTLVQLVLGVGHDDASTSDDYDEEDDPRWEVEWQLLGLLVTTTAFNGLAARWLGSLAPNRRRWLMRFYDVGLVWAALGLALCVGVLLWEAAGTTLWLWSILGREAEAKLAVSPSTFRRAPILLDGALARHKSVIKPLIPGVTLPWSHAPMLVGAFLLGQLVHEPGHAITGALSELATLASSVHLSPIFPSASVRLPAVALSNLSPREKARIAVAGCWHNLTFGLVLWGACAALGGATQRWVGAEGRVVLQVDVSSPLAGILPVGAVVTHLDDFALGVERDDLESSDDKWTSYLGSQQVVAAGWCVERDSFHAQSSDCCAEALDLATSPPALCFLPSGDVNSAGRCLSPSLVTDHPPARIPSGFAAPASGRCPCSRESDICVDVAFQEHILRIGYVDHGRINGKVSWLLWQGAREQVHQQVLTSPYLPPLYLPPFFYSAYLYFAAVKTYVVMISFTLATLNLLPFAMLDGGLSLAAFLAWVLPDQTIASRARRLSFASEDDEVEEGAGVGDRSVARGRDRVSTGVAWAVGGLGAWVVGGMGLRLALGGYG